MLVTWFLACLGSGFGLNSGLAWLWVGLVMGWLLCWLGYDLVSGLTSWLVSGSALFGSMLVSCFGLVLIWFLG